MNTWRVGRSVGRTIYDESDSLIGMMDTTALAATAVADHNARLGYDAGEHKAYTAKRLEAQLDAVRGALKDYQNENVLLRERCKVLEDERHRAWSERDQARCELGQMRAAITTLKERINSALIPS